MQHGFTAVRTDLEHCPATITKTSTSNTPTERCAVEVAVLIHRQSGQRIDSVRSAREAVQHGFISGLGQLVHNSAARDAAGEVTAGIGGTVEVAVRPRN